MKDQYAPKERKYMPWEQPRGTRPKKPERVPNVVTWRAESGQAVPAPRTDAECKLFITVMGKLSAKFATIYGLI